MFSLFKPFHIFDVNNNKWYIAGYINYWENCKIGQYVQHFEHNFCYADFYETLNAESLVLRIETDVVFMIFCYVYIFVHIIKKNIKTCKQFQKACFLIFFKKSVQKQMFFRTSTFMINLQSNKQIEQFSNRFFYQYWFLL